MKRIVFCIGLAAFGIYGCNTNKEAQKSAAGNTETEGSKPQDNVDHGSAQTDTEKVMGTVKMEDGCGAVIEVTYGDVIKRYFPLNLEDKFKKDGLLLKFAFTEEETKAAAGTGCEAIAGVIRLSKVTPLR